MKKQEFLNELTGRLTELPPQEREKSLSYFSEMIDDRMEEGMKEEEAVGSLESLDEIVAKILAEAAQPALREYQEEKEEKTDGGARRAMPAWAIVLIVLGSPVWLALLLAVFSVVLAVLACVFSIIVSFFAVVVSLIAGGIISMLCSPAVFYIKVPSGLFVLGCGCLLTGTGMLLFLPVRMLSKQLIRFVCWMFRSIKQSFKKRRGNA